MWTSGGNPAVHWARFLVAPDASDPPSTACLWESSISGSGSL